MTDKNYVEKVKQTIGKVTDQYMQYDIEESLFIEVLLMEIRGVSISYSSYVKRQRNRQENSLLKDLEDLESQEQLDLEMIEVKKDRFRTLKKKEASRSCYSIKSTMGRRRGKANKIFL